MSENNSNRDVHTLTLLSGGDRGIWLSDEYVIPLDKLYGQRISVIGQSGSGKTNTLKVTARELRRLGLPVVVIDPMGQFRSLADGVSVILAGRSASADVEIRPDNGAAMAQLVVQHRMSIVVDLSLYDPDEEMAVLTAFLPAFWSAVREQEDPPPSALIIDEAHLYAPQQGVTPISKTIIDIGKRGRHKNLLTMVATQRPADIDKRFLTQSGLLIAHSLKFAVDTRLLQEQLPIAKQELNAMARRLDRGEALLVGDMAFTGDADYLRVQVRAADATSPPPALSPKLREGEQNADLDAFRAALRDLMEVPAEVVGDDGAMAEVVNDLRDQMKSLQAMIDEMTRMVNAKDQEIAALHVELNKWKQVQQSLPVSPDDAATPTDDEIDARKEKRGDQAVLRARRRQERQFETMRIKLRAVLDRQWKRDALTVLIDAGLDEGAEGWLSGDDVLRRIGVSASTWSKFPGRALETMRLVERQKQGGEWYYLTDVRDLLPELFPMLDMDVMVQKLREA